MPDRRLVVTCGVIAPYGAVIIRQTPRSALHTALASMDTIQNFSAYHPMSYSAKAPTTPAITITPTFFATFATAAPVLTTVEAVGDAWKVAVALGTTLFERTTTLVEVDIDIKLVGTVMLLVGVRTGML